MFYRLPKLLPYHVLFLASISQQVDISLTEDSWGSTASFIRCPNIAPGVCCSAPNRPYMSFPTAIFHHLDALDIAAVWDSDERPHQPPIAGVPDLLARTIQACSGRVEDSRAGPGTWTWDTVDPHSDDYFPITFASGASYIRLPEQLPPDPRSNYALSMQGILGLAWGGGKWFISPAAKSLLDGRIHSIKGRRGIRSAVKGDVFARSPVRMVYPAFMKLNGTEYTSDDSGAGGFVYTDSSGKKLNLTSWFLKVP
ncbi:MAG: hypothetical protein Q9170_001138 [Blastenia crenularia]